MSVSLGIVSQDNRAEADRAIAAAGVTVSWSGDVYTEDVGDPSSRVIHNGADVSSVADGVRVLMQLPYDQNVFMMPDRAVWNARRDLEIARLRNGNCSPQE